jgi:type I restriction enzyme S subunit
VIEGLWPVPPGWAWSTVGEVGDVTLGRQRSPAQHSGDHMRPYVRAANITWRGLDLTDVKSMNFDPADFQRFRLSPGDVLLNEGSGSAAEVGKSAIWGGNIEGCCFQNTVLRVQPLGASSEYLNAYFNVTASSGGFVRQTQGVNIFHIGKDGLVRFPVPVPPLVEQRRIVAKLDALTARTARARAELDRVPMLAARYRQSVLVAAFRGELTERWRLSSETKVVAVTPRPAEAIRSKFRDQTNQAFAPPFVVPRGWRWLTLPQTGELDRGKSKHRPRGDKRLFGGAYPFIQTGEVRAAPRYLSTCTETYSEFGLKQSRLWGPGTVCITIAANIAETTILGIAACFPDSVVGFTVDAQRTLPEYVEYFLRTVRSELQQFAPATAQKNINLDTLATVRVPIAPVAEQIEIVARIDAAFAEIDHFVAKAAAARRLLDRLDQAILAKAFRGELIAQDPSDEPASVLLDRIRSERAFAPASRRGRRAKAA